MGTITKLKTATHPVEADPAAVSIEKRLIQHLLGTLVANAQALVGEYRAAQVRAYGLMQSGGDVSAIGLALSQLAALVGEDLSEQGKRVVAQAQVGTGTVH